MEATLTNKTTAMFYMLDQGSVMVKPGSAYQRSTIFNWPRIPVRKSWLRLTQPSNYLPNTATQEEPC